MGMVKLFAILAVALCAAPAEAKAEPDPNLYVYQANCLVERLGKTYLSGECTIRLLLDTGTFEVYRPGEAQAVATVLVKGKERRAFLNLKSLDLLKTDNVIGPVVGQDGEHCWGNEIGRICTWPLDEPTPPSASAVDHTHGTTPKQMFLTPQ
jgi:hypothetical protein